MKHMIRILIAAVVVAALLLFVPIPGESLDDGGTRDYTALTYRIVRWNRLHDDGCYRKTRVYVGEDRTRPLDELWQREAPYVSHTFDAIITELSDHNAVVTGMEYEAETGAYTFSTAALDRTDFAVGDYVRVTYRGAICETYPAQIDVVAWQKQSDLRHIVYEDVWLDKSAAALYDAQPQQDDLVITAIYQNCFFARYVIPMSTMCKFNGTLGDEWCVGDQVSVTYQNRYYHADSDRCEAELLGVEESHFQPDPEACYKPVIYLYPEQDTAVDVTLTLDGELTCTYPTYEQGWHVTAAPDGTLTDASGQTYNYLYWEGDTNAAFAIEEGFCIKGEDTAAFLENALAALGLTRREANEFIVYWLPLMQDNPYNLIAFQTDSYTDAAKLDITPAPDTLIRVFMTWQASDTFVSLPAQTLTAPARVGFVAVEWGGTELS